MSVVNIDRRPLLRVVEPPRPIIFLDYDGVIATHRGLIANKGVVIDRQQRWVDPVAVGMLADLCVRFDCRIVVTSTWRMHGVNVCSAALGAIAGRLHDDWKTNERPDAFRPGEIDDWIERNRESMLDYVILDDDTFAWTGEQFARWARCCPADGFTLAAYQKAESLLRGMTKEVEENA